MSESDVNPLLRKALKNRLKIKGLSNPNKIKVPQGRKLSKSTTRRKRKEIKNSSKCFRYK